MAEESKIFETIVGALNTREQFSKVKVNCIDPEASKGAVLSDGLEAVSAEVVFAKNTDKMPIVGGSVVRVNLQNSAIDSTSEVEANQHKLSRYNTNKLKRYSERKIAEIPDGGYQSISQLASARVEINKSLYDMPDIKDGWHAQGIPTLILSGIRSGSIDSSDKLNSEISKNKSSGSRVDGLSKIGTFKYIPKHVMWKMLEAVAPNDYDGEPDYEGLSKYTGISGESFASLRDSLLEDPIVDKDDLIKVILELFPIFHIDEEYIDGPGSAGVIGYFTDLTEGNEGNLYVKMPDLSGRDSGGYSSNIYGVGEESPDDYFNLCFELVKGSQYTAVSIEYEAPPVPEISDLDATHPDGGSDAEISIEKEGLTNPRDYKYFLSPILSPEKAIPARGFTAVSEAVEMFTAPVLTKPFTTRFNSNASPILDASINSAASGDLAKSYRRMHDYIYSSKKVYDAALTAKEQPRANVMSPHGQFLFGGKFFDVENIGIPHSVSCSDIGADSLTDILGEENRPDIILGLRESGDNDAVVRKNDRKYFSDKISSAKELMVSNRPGYVTLDQIPELWIECTPGDPDPDDPESFILKIPSADLRPFSTSISHSFALYVYHEPSGQLIRAPGGNIEILPKDEVIEAVNPTGFFGGGRVLAADALFGCIEVTTSDRNDPVAVNIYRDEAAQILLVSLSDGKELPSLNLAGDPHTVTVKRKGYSIEICSGATLQEVTGTADTGTFWVSVDMGAAGKTPANPIYFAEPGTLLPELPGEPLRIVRFENPFGLKAPRFGKSIDSIPLLLDGSNAEILLKYEKKVFETGTLYAYIAVENNDINKRILEEDVAFSSADEGGRQKSGIVQISGELSPNLQEEYLVPTNLEWKFDTDSFSRINRRKVKLKFPGPNGSNINISRFDELRTEAGGPAAAFLILTTRKLSDGPTGVIFGPGGRNGPDYCSIPLGNGTMEKPAFASPPYITSIVMELAEGGGGKQVLSNSMKSDLGKYKSDVAGIDIESIKEGLPLITSDRIKRLSLIFNGSHSERRINRAYKTSIGTNKIKRFRSTRVRRPELSPGKLVLNYKNIRNIRGEGWIDAVITKRDRRFRVTYDSVFRNQTTVHFKCEDECEDGSVTESVQIAGEEASQLASGVDKFVSRPLEGLKWPEAARMNLSSLIFGGPGPDSPLPLIADSIFFSPAEKVTDAANSYYAFRNPIKIYPSIPLKFGFEGVGIYGMSLSDAATNEMGLPEDEIVQIGTNGSSEVTTPLELAEAAVGRLQEQAGAIKNTVNDTVDDLSDSLSNDELSDEKRAEIEALKQKAESDLAALDSASGEADEAIDSAKTASEAEADAVEMATLYGPEGAPDDGGSSIGDEIVDGIEGAQEAMDDALGAVQDGIAKLNKALAKVQQITDALSSMKMLANQIAEDVEETLSQLGPRANDFIKVNLKHIYIPEGEPISISPVYNDDKSSALAVIKARFEQTAAIRFNVPDIVSIKKRGGESPYSKEKNNLGTLEISTGDKLLIKTLGANKDTKFEISGKRVKARPGVPFRRGAYTNFVLEVPDLNSFSLFGSDPCVGISITNSNENIMRVSRTVGNDMALDLSKKWDGNLFGGKRNKQGPPGELQDKIETAYLKFTSITLDKVNIAKEFLQSFCDMSFHLTAELSLQLRNFKVLLIPIKVILCIIDVICALLHPIRLAFAIIRLFLCLYDLILLLPQLSVPAMYLALLLHVLELLLCVILKILGVINAINEIITALENAIEQKNFPACIALEETINEHLFSLEADLSVLEPILTILALFLELLQLVFSFPCQIGADEDEEACIDPSQLAGIILGKVAPFGRIEPDALLPLAQAYTRLPVEATASTGNSPPDGRDNTEDMDCDTAFKSCDKLINSTVTDFLVRPQDQGGSVVSRGGGAGNSLTGLKDSATGEFKLVEEGGFFSGDEDDSGEMNNIQYRRLRFLADAGPGGDNYDDDGEYLGAGGDSGFFDATFGLSFTRSVKSFAIFTGPDPRIVNFEFNSRGETNDISWWWKILLFPLFFRKKLISDLQTLDAPPMFLRTNGAGELVVDDTTTHGGHDLISPIDGASGFLEQKGGGYQPKPLTVTFDLNEPGVNPDTLSAEFTPVEVTKTFGNIPMIALVDDDFNVYFIEENGADGGIKMENGKISSINVKMINHPSAPKKKFSREEDRVYRNFQAKSDNGGKNEILVEPLIPGGETSGKKLVEAQANAIFLAGLTYKSGDEIDYIAKSKNGAGLEASWSWDEGSEQIDDSSPITVSWTGSSDQVVPGIASFVIRPTADIVPAAEISEVTLESAQDMPFPELGYAYDFSAGGSKDSEDLGNSIDSVKIFDFPRFYIVDMRQVADDIASACGASGPTDLLLDLPGFTNDDELAEGITDLNECVQAFIDHFKSEDEDEDGIPKGIIPKMRHSLSLGEVPEKASVQDIVNKYETLKECVEDQVGKTCKFVLNPLNTSFKLMHDEDETPLSDYIDPEQQSLAGLISYDIVDEIEMDDELAGFPSITGAMEYASGIGDSAVVEAGDKAVVKIIPRDCYDDIMPPTLDLRESIKIDIIKDETGGAVLVSPTSDLDDIFQSNDGEYTFAITAPSPGKVQIKATVCSVVVQAVTDRGIIGQAGPSETDVDCVDDADAVSDDVSFAPGALAKVDRILTILFVSRASGPSGYGDDDRDNSGRSAKPSPQTFGTKLEN